MRWRSRAPLKSHIFWMPAWSWWLYEAQYVFLLQIPTETAFKVHLPFRVIKLAKFSPWPTGYYIHNQEGKMKWLVWYYSKLFQLENKIDPPPPTCMTLYITFKCVSSVYTDTLLWFHHQRCCRSWSMGHLSLLNMLNEYNQVINLAQYALWPEKTTKILPIFMVISNYHVFSRIRTVSANGTFTESLPDKSSKYLLVILYYNGIRPRTLASLGFTNSLIAFTKNSRGNWIGPSFLSVS